MKEINHYTVSIDSNGIKTISEKYLTIESIEELEEIERIAREQREILIRHYQKNEMILKLARGDFE